MRILSLNAWGGRVHAPLLAFLAGSGADAICLQEVTRDPAGGGDGWLDYRDGDLVLPQRADLFNELRAALPGHEGHFCAAARGPLYAGSEERPSDWGLATFLRQTLLIIGQAQDFVHGDYRSDGWGPHPRARNAHAVRLFDPRLGAALTVAQVHGLRDPAGKGDTPARAAQAEALVRLLGRIARPGERLVLCGDFNLLPGSAAFDRLRDAFGLRDLVTAHGHDGTRTTLYPKPVRFADYLLVSPEVEVRRFDVLREPEVSDHCALVLDLS